LIAQISYLEDKISKTWKISPWGHFRGNLGYFGEFFGF
jgi:hypothetical protein